jgi:glycosyltransferase involved in cell wall biosynthesis
MIDRVSNTRKGAKKPDLSVLIPSYRDDATPLLERLLDETRNGLNVEIMIYDDGTGDEKINAGLAAICKNSGTSVSLFFADLNKGRSAARNHLVDNARADWVLFLDADMRPQSDDFLDIYLAKINKDNADIVFGGFTVPDQKQSGDTELHRAFSQSSDCLDAATRTAKGPQYVASSNLCVRKSVLKTEPFDTGFTGWGWEDSEWAARVAKKYKLKHLDNPALHLGLESTETLLSRFKTSGPNYIRFTRAHPELAKSLTLYKMSQRLMTLPGQKLMRPFLAFMVRRSFTPTKLRLLALKLWRASWYAQAFKTDAFKTGAS